MFAVEQQKIALSGPVPTMENTIGKKEPAAAEKHPEHRYPVDNWQIHDAARLVQTTDNANPLQSRKYLVERHKLLSVEEWHSIQAWTESALTMDISIEYRS
jgi:hypothetical protein